MWKPGRSNFIVTWSIVWARCARVSAPFLAGCPGRLHGWGSRSTSCFHAQLLARRLLLGFWLWCKAHMSIVDFLRVNLLLYKWSLGKAYSTTRIGSKVGPRFLRECMVLAKPNSKLTVKLNVSIYPAFQMRMSILRKSCILLWKITRRVRRYAVVWCHSVN
jgi:hypothetical protein